MIDFRATSRAARGPLGIGRLNPPGSFGPPFEGGAGLANPLRSTKVWHGGWRSWPVGGVFWGGGNSIKACGESGLARLVKTLNSLVTAGISQTIKRPS